jgi:DNA topoisomerase-1
LARDAEARFYKPFHATIGTVKRNRGTRHRMRANWVSIPEAGKKVYARIGRFGPMIQIGEAEMRRSRVSPAFARTRASLQHHLRGGHGPVQAAAHPRRTRWRSVSVGIGRFGPYVRLGTTYASLTPEDDPLEIDLRGLWNWST